MESILTIVGIVVLLGVAGGCGFAALKVRQLLGKMDTVVDPKLDEVKGTVHALVPAVGQAEDLMRKVNITMDALDVTLVEVDAKLEKAAAIGGQIVEIPTTVKQLSSAVKSSAKSRFGL